MHGEKWCHLQNEMFNSMQHSPGFAFRRFLHNEFDVEAWVTSLARGANFTGWVIVSDARNALLSMWREREYYIDQLTLKGKKQKIYSAKVRYSRRGIARIQSIPLQAQERKSHIRRRGHTERTRARGLHRLDRCMEGSYIHKT